MVDPATASTASAAVKESLFSRLILAPLAFLSFLISLALVSYSDTEQRTRAQPVEVTWGDKIKNALGLGRKYQPYEYVRSPAHDDTSAAIASPGLRQRNVDGGKQGANEPWHWHTKQKKLLKLEISEAFEMRKKVVILLLVSWILVGWASYATVKWAWGRLSGFSS